MLVYGVRTVIDGQQVSGATFWEEPEKSERKKNQGAKENQKSRHSNPSQRMGLQIQYKTDAEYDTHPIIYYRP